jgi:excisionase family DNA binding protein
MTRVREAFAPNGAPDFGPGGATATAAPADRPAGKPWPVVEAADFLGISERTLWRLIDARDVKVTRLGRRVLVIDSEVRRLANGEGK